MLNRLKIGTKFALTFAVLIGLFLAVAGTAFVSLMTIEEADGWNTHTYNVLGHSNTLIASVVNQETGVRGFLVSGDENFLEPFMGGKEEFQTALATLLKLTSDNAAQQQRLTKIGALEQEWRTTVAEREIALMKDPATIEDARAVESSGAGKGLMDALRGVHGEFESAESSLLVTRTESKNSASSFADWAIVLGSGVILILAAGMGFILTRHVASAVSSLNGVMANLASGDNEIEVPYQDRGDEIGAMAQSVLVFRNAAVDKQRNEHEADQHRSLSEKERADREAAKQAEAANLNKAIEALADGLSKLSQGDLTVAISQPFEGELDNLRQSFNGSVAKLSETLSEVKISTDGIQSNADEMRSAVDELSTRTERQAAALEESSAALEEISSTVKSSSDRAQDATKKVAEAKTASDSSTKVVADAVEAMGNIKDASSEISKIIGVIDEIAFQTNLLALNAGVEAARAGEAGKGFAVVAQEVRELAQRSATAAKEIKGLIGKSSTAVESGVDLVKATGDALAVIAGHVTDINDHINSIATAAQEQATGLQEVSAAVGQMDQVTQQNAAMVEETTALTHRLSDESTQLATLVQRFRVAGSGGRAAAAPVAASAASVSRPSPAKAMVNKVRQAFASNGSAAVDQWSEF